MEKPIKTFEETLAEEMRDPEFREGFLQAKAEIEAFARKRDSRRANGRSRRGRCGRPESGERSGAVRQAPRRQLKALLEGLAESPRNPLEMRADRRKFSF